MQTVTGSAWEMTMFLFNETQMKPIKTQNTKILLYEDKMRSKCFWCNLVYFTVQYWGNVCHLNKFKVISI